MNHILAGRREEERSGRGEKSYLFFFLPFLSSSQLTTTQHLTR
jgi:hypothetical protein